MKTISNLISEGFIWGVGITRPRPGQERRAAMYITGTLLGTVALVGGMFLLLLDRIMR